MFFVYTTIGYWYNMVQHAQNTPTKYTDACICNTTIHIIHVVTT